MSKIMIIAVFVFSCASLASAQDDYHKVEVFGGYSYNSADRIAGSEFTTSTVGSQFSSGKRKGFQGFDTSVTYNFSRYVGAKFDFSGHYGESTGIIYTE